MTRPRIVVCIYMLLLLLAVPVAGATRVDSLRKVVSQTSDDEKSDAYAQLSRELANQGDAELGLRLLEEWAAFERGRGNLEREGKVRWSKIATLSNFCLDDALLAEAPVQMSWFEAQGQWENYYNTWECKAGVYLYSNRVQTALHEAEQMLHDAQRRDNDFGRVVSYLLTGMIYENMSQCKPAIENLDKALALVKQQKSSGDIIFSVYDYLCQALDADEQYDRELVLSDEWKATIERYRQQKKFGPNSFRGADISRMVQRASALIGLGRTEEAAETLDEADEILADTNTPVSNYKVYICRTRLYLREKKPEQAIACLDSLEQLGIAVGGSVRYLRGDAMMMMSRYKEAAELYREEYLSLDTVYNQDLRTQLSELATLHHLDETEMKSRLAQTRLMIIIAVVVFVALLIIIFQIYRSSKRLAQKNREQEEVNEQLRLANLRAEDSLKMRSDFIKSISHEIRTPLNILSGFTQIITTPGADLPAEQLQDIHKRINENTERIVQLTNKLLELSDSNSHTAIDRQDIVTAGDIVNGAIRQSRIASTGTVVFSWDAGDPLAATELRTHRTYAVRALGCLLDNAQKFTSEGMVAVRLTKGTDALQFAVEDTGIGVQAEQAERIFDEFVQIDNYTDGAGIGLTVARSIARRLGGDIKLDTDYTAGARFVMSLPLS
ncbi:MAG: hypothetical protein IJ570_07480 [Prevotella sp.]|nr:hypothetical protein [Prevotella sp.]